MEKAMKSAVTAEALPRLLKAKEVARLTTLSAPTIHVLATEGHFPKPLRLTGKRVAWREKDVLSWIESRETAA